MKGVRYNRPLMSFHRAARSLFVVSLLLAAAFARTAAAEPPAQTPSRTLSGLVRDSSGGAVAGALVIARASGQPSKEQQATTGADGQFTLELPPSFSSVTLIVRAGGFAENQQQLTEA